MKTKTKKITTSKTVTQKKKSVEYPAHYLAIILAVVLIAEGIIMGSAQTGDWAEALQIMDASAAVTQTVAALSATAQPGIDLISDINQFYQIAATEMTTLLDVSDSAGDFNLIFAGVDEFYQQASIQMAYLFDFSSMAKLQPHVAGISIIK